MNWNAPLRVSRALVLQLGEDGWMATSSVSRRPQAVDSDALPVLEAFSRPATPRQALAALEQEWEVEEGELGTVVERLLEEGLLVLDDGAPAELASTGFASTLAHYHMVRDRRRVETYRAAIERHCRGRSVVEVGCGSGILSLLAARAGARRVVAIEESEIAGLAREMIAANGFGDVIEVVTANSRDVELDDKAEVLIHEIFGSDPFEENVISFIADARERFLVPGGRLIPDRLEVACRGFAVEREPALEREQALAVAGEFEADYGLDFGPFLDALGKVPEQRFGHTLRSPSSEPFPHALLTGEAPVFDLDLDRADPSALAETVEVELPVEAAGRLGGVLIYFRAHMDEETVLSTSPADPPTHWGWTVKPLREARSVAPGDRVRLAVQARTERGAPRMSVDLA